MWYTILLDKLFGGVTDYFKNKQKLEEAKLTAEINRQTKIIEGELDWDTQAMLQKDKTYVDEILFLIIYSPLIVAWFYPEKALAWVQFVSDLPVYYQTMMIGILISTFGLRWMYSKK